MKTSYYSTGVHTTIYEKIQKKGNIVTKKEDTTGTCRTN